jgi:hypothetical protein
VLIVLGGREIEVPCDKDPVVVDFSGAVSEDDKVLLNCLEHVSRVGVCYLIDSFVKLTLYFFLGSGNIDGLDSREVHGGGGVTTRRRAGLISRLFCWFALFGIG